MAKRFSDTEIWKKEWFCDLSPALKTFWRYICDNCDNAGVWEMNIPLAEFQIGCKLRLEDILTDFHGNIRQISSNKLLVVDFIQFQYGELKKECIPHRNIFKLLEKHEIRYPIDRVLYTLKDKEEDKDLKEGGVGETKQDKKSKKDILPTLQEVEEYFKHNGYSKEHAKKFYDSYSVNNWIDSRGNRVKCWKQKAIMVWFKNEGKLIKQEALPLAYRPLPRQTQQ